MKMSFLHFLTYLCTVILVGCHSGFAKVTDKWFAMPGKNSSPCHITVDLSGHGNFSSVQSAINTIPSNNKKWVCIFVKAGVYREKVKIPYDKPFIILKGEGRKKTQIIWDDHQSVVQSPTFATLADNIVVRSISFVNSYNSPGGGNKNPRAPAVAAMVAGDKTSFYKCGFSGVQDTLWDDQGRHYFSDCTIEGAVDFIFGSGQSIYEKCEIHMLGEALEPGLTGFITAQGRTNKNDANGFVFKGGVVYGKGSAYLGRPWRGYARVLFYKTTLTGVVKPEGWDAWNEVGHENQITFAEYGCFGQGSDTSRRVKWAKTLTNAAVNQLITTAFIDSEGWLGQQPV